MPDNHYILETVHLFAKNPRPTLADKARIEELILGHIGSLPPRGAQSICSQLATCPHVPLSLFLALCDLPIDICRPLLASPFPFSSTNLHGIIETDLEKGRIIARNTELDLRTIECLRDINDPSIDRSLDLRQRPVAEYARVPDNDLLNSTSSPLATSHLLDTIDDENDAVIHTALSDLLGLSLESIAALCSDPSSRNLPTALHFLRLSTKDAWAVYERLMRSYESNEEVKRAFENVYFQLELRSSQAIVNAWQIDELVAIVKSNSAANDVEETRMARSS